MSIELAELVIDISDPERQGLYRDFQTTIATKIGKLVAGEGYPFRFRLVKRNLSSAPGPWQDVALTDAEIVFALSELRKGADSGTFALSYNGSSTGLTALAYNISAADLQTALNANAAVSAGGATVTVTKTSSLYIVAWNQVGARFLLGSTVSGLVPDIGTNVVSRRHIGDASTKEVQLISLVAAPYVTADDWTTYAEASVEVTEQQAGDAETKAVRTVEFGAKPYGGIVILNFPKPEIVTITAKANPITPGVGQVFSVTVSPSVVPANLAGKFFLCYDNVGPIYVWFESSAVGTAPAAPFGGRNIKVTILDSDTAFAVAGKIASDLDADSKFTATNAANVATITDINSGARSGPADVNIASEGVTLAVVTPGSADSAGVLKNAFFVLQESTGTVAFWFSTSGSAMPAAVLAYNRQVTVTIADADTASQVAIAIDTAITGDGSYTSDVAANVVTATDAVGGPREAPISAALLVTQIQFGQALTAAIQAGTTTAGELATALENYWSVSKAGYNFTLVAGQVGVQPDFAVADERLVGESGVKGTLDLLVPELLIAFAATTEDAIDLLFSGVVTFPGQLPFTIYREEVSILRSGFDSGNTIAPSTVHQSEGVVSLVAGTSSQHVTLSPVHAVAPTKFELTQIIPTGGEFLVMAVDGTTAATNGFDILFGGPVPTPATGYKVSWKAK